MYNRHLREVLIVFVQRLKYIEISNKVNGGEEGSRTFENGELVMMLDED